MLGDRWKLSNLSNTCPHDAIQKGAPYGVRFGYLPETLQIGTTFYDRH
jgi:hypothetical protein